MEKIVRENLNESHKSYESRLKRVKNEVDKMSVITFCRKLEELRLTVDIREDFNNPGVYEFIIRDLDREDSYNLSEVEKVQLFWLPKENEEKTGYKEGWELADDYGTPLAPMSKKWDQIFIKLARMKYGTPQQVDKKIKQYEDEIQKLKRVLRYVDPKRYLK